MQKMMPVSALRALAIVACGMGSSAFAADGKLITIVNWYELVLAGFVGHEVAEHWWPVAGSLFALLLVAVVGWRAGLWRIDPATATDDELLPPARFGFRAFVEMLWAIVSSTLASIIGEQHWQKFASILGGTFMFIIITNLSGLVPGFAPATEQMNMTLAMGIVIFFLFNYVGLKYAGLDYVKHLFGPVIALAPLMFIIEFVGMLARPLSLGLRLFGNVSGDHLVFSVFSTVQKIFHMPWLPLPVALLAFGLLVACLQSFIFMTLSAVYVRLALDTAHHSSGH